MTNLKDKNISPIELPLAISQYLSTLAQRRRKLALIRGAGLALAIWMAGLLLLCWADRVFHLPGALRLVLLISHVGGIFALLTLTLWRWYRPTDDAVATSLLAERLDASLPSQLLSTATSRVLGRSAERGSPAMLTSIVDEATTVVDGRDPTSLLPTQLALTPWFACAGAFLLSLILLFSSWLSLPRLVARYALPLADIAPVTTTRLSVSPGNVGVPQNEPLIISVTADRLSPAAPQPRLHVSYDAGITWSRYPMAMGDSGYVYRFDSLSQDARYFVTGGDATSPTFDLRVLRQPLVTEFRVRYVFPKYTSRSPLNVTNRSGLIEAPAGTEATITFIASEALNDAAMLVHEGPKDQPPRVVPTSATVDPASRQLKLQIDKNADYTLMLTSERGVKVEAPTRHAIRALPDRPPLVRVYDVGQDARPGPRDVMPVAYQALDDYGLDEVVAVVRVNGGPPIRIGLKVQGDLRRQEQTYPLDIAPLDVKVGDVLAVTIDAKDGRGQWASSRALSALVSPRAIDLNAHQRVVELAAAQGVAQRLVTAWDDARKAIEALARFDDAPADGPAAKRAMAQVLAVAQVNRNLMAASESAAVLRQSLLRATARSSGHEMSVTLAKLLDDTQQELIASERMLGMRTSEVAKQADTKAPLETARRLRDALTTLARGERSTAVLAEVDNVAAARERGRDAAYPQALKEGIKRLADDLAASLRQLEIDPNAANVKDRLNDNIEASNRLMRDYKMLDFATSAGTWSKEIEKPHQPTGFDERLAIAAQAESVRPDADLVRARDVSIASQAAGRIERNEVAPTTQPTDPLPRELFPASMLAVQRWHELSRPMNDRPPTDEIADRDRLATEGRRRMGVWAGHESGLSMDSGGTVGATPTTQVADAAEAIAMEANAASARKDYSAVRRLDRELARATGPQTSAVDGADESERVAPYARTMAAAERIDSLAAEQNALAEETASTGAIAANELAGRQDRIGEAIGGVQEATRPELRGPENPDWREEATAAIAAAQAQLAAMPQALASTARADSVRRDATDRASKSRQAAASAPPDQRDVLLRLSEQADRDVQDTQHQVALVAEPLRPAVVESLSARLAVYRPPTHASVEAIESDLLPALRSVGQSLTANDSGSFDRAASQTRKAIERVQAELTRARDELIERDPLVAAKWFSRAASAALRETPPDMLAAKAHQQSAGVALSKAWDRSIHTAANQRLAGVPAMSPVFNLFPSQTSETNGIAGVAVAGAGSGAGNTAAQAVSALPGARQWGLLRPMGDQNTTAVRRDPDPPGFEEPIRLYFEALSKLKEAGK